MELGWAYPKRIELLRNLASDIQTKKDTWPVEFQGKTQHPKIEYVPVGMPKYNLQNGRTGTAQKTYLARHKEKPKDLFSGDIESSEAQAAQHDILLAHINEKGLLTYFKTNVQKEPLLLTPSGIVINGNRRLCAMRSLFESDRTKYAHFGDIQVCVLPSSDERALSDLEFNLQVSNDIKAGYSWTNEADMLRARMGKYKYTIEELSGRSDKTAPQIQQLFDMLDYADLYLKQRSKEDEYDLVDDKEFAFRRIVEDRKKLQGEDKVLFQQLSFAVMDAPKGDRAYQTIQDIAKYIESIEDALSTRLRASAGNTDSTSSDLDDLLGGGSSSLAGLIKQVSDISNSEVVRDIIVETVNARKSLESERKKTDFVVAQVRKANTALTEALMAADGMMSKTGVLEQLVAMSIPIEQLKAWAVK